MTRSYSHCSCGARLQTRDTRHKTYGDTETTYRRKICPNGCGTKVSTLELPMAIVSRVLGKYNGMRLLSLKRRKT